MKHRSPTFRATLALLTVALLVAAPARSQESPAPVIEITAEDYAFRAPAEIASGWNTFRLENAGTETHMLFVGRLPDGITYDDYMNDAVLVFNEAWYRLRDGDIGPDEVFSVIGESLKPWFWTMPFMGGVGLLEPGATAEATMYLEPGNYVIECYMRTSAGEMHSMEGMVDPLTVTAAPSGGVPPTADVRITLSERGMALEGDIQAGRRTFEVHYADHPEGTFGHDVEVIRLNEGVTADDVIRWLSFEHVEALTDPAPGAFRGGINQMPAGSTAYFSTELLPGRYLFVSEFTSQLGVYREVRVDP